MSKNELYYLLYVVVKIEVEIIHTRQGTPKALMILYARIQLIHILSSELEALCGSPHRTCSQILSHPLTIYIAINQLRY